MLEHEDVNVTTVDAERYLEGVDFPADLDELIDCAMENGAPEEVIDALEQMPDREYSSFADVEKGFGEVYE